MEKGKLLIKSHGLEEEEWNNCVDFDRKKIVRKKIKDKESQKIRKITQEHYLQTTVSLVTLSVYNET